MPTTEASSDTEQNPKTFRGREDFFPKAAAKQQHSALEEIEMSGKQKRRRGVSRGLELCLSWASGS